ncbi:MAG: aquaporin family protein [Cytophagales bacterium]|jgi:glycerol uptake facilitator protein|nr:aquaporin family protein [Cytophagales bacterium]MCA6387871.1 aquaporin family protein [Cytophagales bacterium]MCA6390951.1 aquaporin family protein [Cytophagales bacterium]MCA6394911.1 aquaporin family protein [Cytophagales bacterium]MCA6398374.1 aquaporin family protein [Cytophagales bacterium]
MSPYVAEFFGTLLLILLGGGVNAAVSLKKSKSENGGWLMIAIGWGLAVTLAIYAVGNISGAHLNPAVTIALAINGSFPPDLILGYILAQFAGAIVGATLVWLHYLPHWKETADPSAKLGVFCNAPAIRNVFTNLISEIIATMVLIMALLFIGANEFTKGLNPIVVGLLIISIGLSLGGTTGFAINPARDLGPRIAHFILPIHGKGKSDWSYAWIPVLGPIIGGVVGVWIYQLLF